MSVQVEIIPALLMLACFLSAAFLWGREFERRRGNPPR